MALLLGETACIRMFGLHLLSVFHDVLRIVSYTLEIRYRMVDGGDVDLIPLIELVLGQLDQETGYLLVEEVQLLFVLAELLFVLEIEIADHVA